MFTKGFQEGISIYIYIYLYAQFMSNDTYPKFNWQFTDRKSKTLRRYCFSIATFFDNDKVPQKYRIGEEGKGFIYQMNQFQDERLVAGVQGNNI